jgi:urease accessory protein
MWARRSHTPTSAKTTPTEDHTPTEHHAVVRAERRGARTVVSRLASKAPLGARVLPSVGGVCRVALVHTAATLVSGDAVHLEVDIGPGASCELFEISATVAHPMSAGAQIEKLVEVAIADEGALVMREQALVLAQATDLRRTTRFALSSGARAVHREMLVLGRVGETPGHALIRSRVERDGSPVFDDAIDTGDLGVLHSPAVFGNARVLGACSLWGAASTLEGAGIFAVSPSDRVFRVLAETAARATDALDAFEGRLVEEQPWVT